MFQHHTINYFWSMHYKCSGDPIPVTATFSAFVQTSSGAHPTSCTMGTGFFPGVKRPGRGVDHPPRSSAYVKERAQLYHYSPSGASWSVIGWPLSLPFLIVKTYRGCFTTNINISVCALPFYKYRDYFLQLRPCILKLWWKKAQRKAFSK
jgi:hypothetical protein